MFKWKCIGHDQKLCITQLWTHFRKLTWGLHYMWCRISIKSQQQHAAENEEIDEICYISHGIGINSKDLCWMNKCNWYVLYSLYIKHPLGYREMLLLYGLFMFVNILVLICTYILYTYKCQIFKWCVFSTTTKKKIIPQCSCI